MRIIVIILRFARPIKYIMLQYNVKYCLLDNITFLFIIIGFRHKFVKESFAVSARVYIELKFAS